MSVPSSKAAGFTTVIAVLRETIDPNAFVRFVAALPAETAQLVDVPPIAIAWLPIDHFYAVVDTAHRVLFASSDDGIVALGHRSIGRDMSTIYRVLIGLAPPSSSFRERRSCGASTTATMARSQCRCVARRWPTSSTGAFRSGPRPRFGCSSGARFAPCSKRRGFAMSPRSRWRRWQVGR